MPFQKVQPEKLSTAVVRQIEKLILRGILRPGERLPSERELAERLGVSRPSLRDALAELQDRGLLSSRAGSGVFVADVLGSAFSPALIQLFASDDEAVFDYLSFRRDLEGMAAERRIMFGQHTTYEALLEQHRAINAALQARDAHAARTAVETHMDYVKQALDEQIRADRNARIAAQRLEHERNR